MWFGTKKQNDGAKLYSRTAAFICRKVMLRPSCGKMPEQEMNIVLNDVDERGKRTVIGQRVQCGARATTVSWTRWVVLGPLTTCPRIPLRHHTMRRVAWSDGVEQGQKKIPTKDSSARGEVLDGAVQTDEDVGDGDDDERF